MVRITMNIATQKMQHVQIRQSPYHPLPPTGLITVSLIPSHFQHEPNELTCGTRAKWVSRTVFPSPASKLLYSTSFNANAVLTSARYMRTAELW